MNAKNLRRTLLLIAACCGPAKAEVFTSGCTLQVDQACSLAELVYNPDAFLEIDGVRFVNFTQSNISFDIASRISVGAVDGPGGADQPGNVVGLEFSPIDGMPSLLEGFGSQNVERFFNIAYDIKVSAGLPVAASSMSIRFGDASFNLGDQLVLGGLNKTISRAGLADTTMQASCRMASPAESCAGRQAADNVTFGPARDLSISDTFFIAHFVIPTPTDSMAAFSPSGIQTLGSRQTFFRVPEPGVSALLAIGLGAMGLAAGRRRRVARPAASDWN